MTDPAPAPSETPEAPTRPKTGGLGWVRLVSDLGPALVFFFAYQFADRRGVPEAFQPLVANEAILFATVCFLPAAVAGFVFSWLKERQVSPLGVFTFVMIAVFSGLALWLQDDTFIKMRPTLIYGLMGLILLVSLAVRRNVLKMLFGGAMHMAEQHWRGLTFRAGILYLCLSVINEVVWRTFGDDVWVPYNTWGDVAINLVFWVVNFMMLARHLTDADGNPLTETSSEPKKP